MSNQRAAEAQSILNAVEEAYWALKQESANRNYLAFYAHGITTLNSIAKESEAQRKAKGEYFK